MSLALFEQLLKEMIGLDSESVGVPAIERAVKERQAAGRFDNPLAYWEFLQSCETERQMLVEAVVVPETWFLRDRGAFDAVARIAGREWRTARSESVVRILSVPCSSGEEPYSIAMALHEAGFSPNQYRIDGADVSRPALAKGRLGVYGENSFRGHDIGFRDRYFARTANGYQLDEALRSQVCFHHGNLLSSAFFANAEPYDAIFCRNLFIYFDRSTQQRAIGALARLLIPDGLLFVGSSETGVFMDQDFVSANLPKAFAFRRKSVERRPARDLRRQSGRVDVRPPAPSVPFALAARACRSVPAITRATVTPPAIVPAPVERQATIEEAYQLADQGHFAEAAKLCDDHVRREGPSARAFYLLGLVRDASGNATDAESLYRKALYLDPDHRESLVQLALLMDRQGNPAGAQVLRKRVRRLETMSGT